MNPTNTAKNFRKGQTAYTVEFSYDVNSPAVVAYITALEIDSMGKRQGTAHRIENGQMLKVRIYGNHRMFANINEAIEVATVEGAANGEAHKRNNIKLDSEWLAKYGPNFKFPKAAEDVKARLESFQTKPVTVQMVYR